MRFLYIALISLLVHTVLHADVIDFSLTMTGAQEVPSNGSSGTGGETGGGCFYDTDSNILTLEFQYSGLSSNTNNAHIHGPAAAGVSAGPVFGLTGFVFGNTSGSYSNTFTLTGAQETDLLADLYYVNIHTVNFGGGEIRGQLINEGVLPVELVSFSASFEKNIVLLQWKTATEVNNHGFEIERQVGSRQYAVGNQTQNAWGTLGFIKGNGNSNSVKEYSFIDKEISSETYLYRLKQIDNDGQFEYSNTVEVSFMKPDQFALEQNYPNPFNPATNMQYAIGNKQLVTLKVYDVLGKEVATLVNEEKEPGAYEVEFSASGFSLSSGVYFYTLTAGSYTATKKLLLMK